MINDSSTQTGFLSYLKDWLCGDWSVITEDGVNFVQMKHVVLLNYIA